MSRSEPLCLIMVSAQSLRPGVGPALPLPSPVSPEVTLPWSQYWSFLCMFSYYSYIHTQFIGFGACFQALHKWYHLVPIFGLLSQHCVRETAPADVGSASAPPYGAAEYSSMEPYRILFMPSPTDGPLGGLQFLTVTNRAPVNVPVPVCCGQVSSGATPRGELLGHRVHLFNMTRQPPSCCAIPLLGRQQARCLHYLSAPSHQGRKEFLGPVYKWSMS